MPRPVPFNFSEKGIEFEPGTGPIWMPDKESQKTFKALMSLMQAKGRFIDSPNALIAELNERKAQDLSQERGEMIDRKEIEIRYDTLYTMIDLSLFTLKEKKQTNSKEYKILNKTKDLIKKAITERLNVNWLEIS